MLTAAVKRRFTVDEYYRMAEAGILKPGERTELIEGEIIQMASIGSRHAACVNRLNTILVRGVADDALVTVQNPVRLGDISEPQPDLAVVRPKDDQYAAGHPRPADVLLLIEVADSTVGFDRGDKAPLYAAYGIPEYWLVDIPGEQIEVFRGPSPDGWAEVSRHTRGDVLRPQALPELVIAVEAILGILG